MAAVPPSLPVKSTPGDPSTTPSAPPTSASSSPTSISSSTTTSSSSSIATSSSSSTTSSSSSTGSSSSSTSTTPTTANTPLTPTTGKSLTTSLPTTAGRGVTTQFTTAFVSNSADLTPSTTAAASTGSKSFFKNTGAVAGTFSVVGLIVLALIIALITNGIRRRRARKFDRELAAATLEAASAPKPIFLDDEDDVGGSYGARGGYGAGGGGGGGADYGDYTSGGGFSDVSSHGTYGQPPMSVAGHGQEAYGMRELGHVGPGEIYDPYSVAGVGAAAGAAGIGVARARSQKAQVEGGGYGAALQDGSAPYAAFAAPQAGGYDPYANNGGSYQRNADILEAAGMGAHVAGAGALARGPSMSYASSTQYSAQQAQYGQQQLHHRTTPSQEYSLGRNKSIGGMGAVQEYDDPNNLHIQAQPMSAASGASGATQYFSPATESYASHYQTGPAQSQLQPQSQLEQGHQRGYSATSGEDMDDAYGGYVADMQGGGQRQSQSGVPNPFAVSEPGHGHVQQGSGSDRESRYSDEEEVEEQPRRVLKVANE